MFPRLWGRDILLLLCAKAGALALIYFLFIVPAAKPAPDSVAMRTHLLGGGDR